eukprot:COSAG05_NODE_5090_length_1265_cov_1.289880_2_plen_90_part_00
MVFSNSTLMVGPGIFVAGKTCGKGGGADNAFISKASGKAAALSYTIDGAKVLIECKAGDTVYVNADVAHCFLYNSDNKLPAPPIEIVCK